MDQTKNGHNHAKSKNMFELLNDLQSARLNDQRTNMPRNTNINTSYPLQSELKFRKKSHFCGTKNAFFDIFKSTKHFLLFQKWEKIHFCTQKKMFKTMK